MKTLRWLTILPAAICLALGQSASAQPAAPGAPAGKAVAIVKGVTLSEEEYLNRVQYVRQIPQQFSLDAGGVTLVNMIDDILTEQLCKEKNVVPTEDSVKQLAEIFRRTTPSIEQQFVSKQLSDMELYRQVRKVLELTALGSDGAKPEAADVQKAYDEMKKNPIYPATYTIRVLVVPDPVKANDVLPQLKATGNFKEAAKTLKMTAAEISRAGSELVMQKKDAPPELVKALDDLGNGPFTPEKGPFTGSVAVTQKNPTNPTSAPTIYVIAQLIGKQAEETPAMDKLKVFLEQQALQQSRPQWQLHAQQQLGEYTKTAQITINIERYKPLLESVILAQASAHTDAPPQGAPGGPGGQGGPPPGATAPPPSAPPSGGASAPPPSTPPSKGAPTPGTAPAPKAGGAAGAPK